MAWRDRVGSINRKVEQGADSTNDGQDSEAIGYRRSSRSRQAPTRATNATNENIVRTLFQKFHGSSYPARARELDRRRIGGDAGELLVQRHVHENRQQESAPNVEDAGQSNQPETARAGPWEVHGERREQEQYGPKEAREKQRVLYPLVDSLHPGDV